MPANPQDQILSIVALINALGVVIVAVIHAFRVPYRESAVKEAWPPMRQGSRPRQGG